MRTSNRFLIIAAVALLATACSREHLREDFGNATAINHAAQAVDPQAETRQRGEPAIDGQKVEQGLKRYRADKPEATRAKLVSETGN
jgi:type IV pilus biogenesis protein CpaD/CtpE